MSQFCTQCGTPASAGSAFCEQCGAKLKPAATAAAATPATPSASGAGFRPSRNLVLAAGGGVALLAVAIAAAVLLSGPPSASQDKLLAAVKTAGASGATADFKRQLCLGNLPYSGQQPINTEAYDAGTNGWMKALVDAGLYQAPVQVQSGGFMPRVLLQYAPTAELPKWLEGQRLCLAKGAAPAAVEDVQEVRKVPTAAGESYRTEGTLVVRASEPAPWVRTPALQQQLPQRLDGWQVRDGQLERRGRVAFSVRDGEWVVGDAVPAVARRDARQAAPEPASSGGLFAKLASLFGGNPLQGRWRAAADTPEMQIAAGMLPEMVFTGDTMEVGGSVQKVRYEIDGQRVRVIGEGTGQGVVVQLEGPDTFRMDTGLVAMRYKRVGR